jgi:predicted nucleotide-binding protein
MDKRKLIENLIEQVKQLSFEDKTGFDKFRNRATMILDNISEGHRGYSAQLLNIDLYPLYQLDSYDEHREYWGQRKKKIQNLLETIHEEMELFPDRKAEMARLSEKIFIAHGHDGEMEKAQKPDKESLTMKEKREQFLFKLNEMSEGNINKSIESMRIGDTLGFDRATTFNCARYFDQKGFIKLRDDAGGAISITAEGIDEADKIQSRTVAPSSDQGNDVFIVHGHDIEAKESVARHVEKLGLKAIILHEMPNKGRAVIEKFEDYSNVGFAVVLLTPDDLGASKDKREELKPRARQNVIFEFGYFVGKLRRERVCVLYKENVEIPSEYEGILYVEMDKGGGWKQALTKEMKEAGIRIDPAKLLY